MGKGSRNRENRVVDNEANETVGAKLSKKQLIKLQQKKARNKKIISWIVTAAVAIALVTAIIITNLPNIPDLEKNIVAEVGDIKIDGAMFAYVVYGYVNQYASYMSSYGYNANLGLLNQTTTYKSGSTSMTWYQYFCGMAENSINQYVAFASAAKAKGMSLDADDIKEIDDTMKSLKKMALQSGFGGTNKFLNAAYTPGVTEGAVRRVAELEKLATKYVEDFIEGLEYTDEQLEQYKTETPDSFLKIDFVSYDFTPEYKKDATADEKKAAYEAAKAAAEAFKAQYTTVESFKAAIIAAEQAKEEAKNTSATGTTAPKKATELTDAEKEEILKDFITEGELYDGTKATATATKDYYEWAYSTERVANDMFIQENKASNNDLSYTVYIIEKPVYIDLYTTQNVRHILFDVDTSLKGTALEKAFNEAKKEAEEVLAKYNEGEKTAEKFGELAKEYTSDSNGDKGGLYENVLKNQMTTEFTDWIYDENRQVGDVELVKTTYGWHIMYYAGQGQVAWKVTAEEELKEEDYDKHMEDLTKNVYPVEYDYEAMFVSLGGDM